MDDEIEKLKSQNEKLVSVLQFIADYGNYVTEGNIETTERVLHVSDFAENELNAITKEQQ